MKNRPIEGANANINNNNNNNNNNNINVVTEWEDNILFDADDPDFCNILPTAVNVLNPSTAAIVVVPPPMLGDVIDVTGLSGLHMKGSVSGIKTKAPKREVPIL